MVMMNSVFWSRKPLYIGYCLVRYTGTYKQVITCAYAVYAVESIRTDTREEANCVLTALIF